MESNLKVSDKANNHAKAKSDYLRNRRQSESERGNPQAILRMTKIALIEFNLYSKINELGPVTIVQLLPYFREDVRLIASCLKNIENRDWVKVIKTTNGCKHFVGYNYKD